MSTDRPLGLPEGSIRAILAIGITIGAFVLFAVKKDFEVSSFLSLVGLPIGLYFGQYISPPGGGPTGQVVPGAAAVDVTDAVGAATRTVGGIVSGVVPAIGSNGGIFTRS